VAIVAVAAMSVAALAGCSTAARAERKGKEAGDEICSAKSADNANEAQRHLRKADDKLDDLSRFTGTDVRQDVRDLDRNLDQLSRGNGTEQDVSRIVNSIEEARSTATGNAAAAYDGLLEALAACD
jgi:hypothetical protein